LAGFAKYISLLYPSILAGNGIFLGQEIFLNQVPLLLVNVLRRINI